MVFGTMHSPQVMAAQAKAASVFTPASPVDSISLFRGRSVQIQMLLETVSQVGQHAIVYGERGVGKTSLVSVLYEIVSQAVLTKFHFAHVNCDVEDTFGSLWRKVFRELHIDDWGHVAVRPKGTLDCRNSLAEYLEDTISPDDIRRLAALVDGKLVVIMDEFDQLSGNLETVRLVANTIKTLSDRKAQMTLILVGVADTVSQLISEHESVERNLVQIQMPRMSDREISQIVTGGLGTLGITVDEANLAYLCSLAQGLPASAHRIGLQIAQHMIESHKVQMDRETIDAALRTAIDRMPQSHLMDWQKATESVNNATMFEDVLIAAALAPRNEQGWFHSDDILEPFRMVTHNKECKARSYSQHLHLLATHRGTVLDRSKSEGRWQFRFRNPSFQSYVLMRGLARGRIKDLTLTQFSQRFPIH